MTSRGLPHSVTRSLLRTSLLTTLLLRLVHLANAAPAVGRATFYGGGDGFTLNDGSCACHKRWGWLSNRCESGHCFDYIGNSTAEHKRTTELEPQLTCGGGGAARNVGEPSRLYLQHLSATVENQPFHSMLIQCSSKLCWWQVMAWTYIMTHP